MILDLAREGLTVSAISRRTGLDPKTIRKYLAQGLDPPAYTPRPPRPTLVGPFEAYLRERLQTFPELSARRLLRDIRERGYQSGHTMLKAFVRTVRPIPVPSPSSAGSRRRPASRAKSVSPSSRRPSPTSPRRSGSSGCSRWCSATAA